MQLTMNENPSAAFAGLVADSGAKDIITGVACSRQLEQVVVTTADNAVAFTITINGNAYAFTSDGSGTKPEISAGLKALIDAGSEGVTVTDDETDTLLIESDSYDAGFTISVAAAGSGVLTLTQLVGQEQNVPFGVVVVADERVAAEASGRLPAVRLPRLATDFSGYKIRGVALADTSRVTLAASPYGGFAAGDALPVLRKGRVWMAVEDIATVAEGGLVYVRHIASASEQLGAIRAADDGGDTEVLTYSQARFTGQKNTALAIAVVEWDLP